MWAAPDLLFALVAERQRAIRDRAASYRLRRAVPADGRLRSLVHRRRLRHPMSGS
jgi:hypothetical protein